MEHRHHKTGLLVYAKVKQKRGWLGEIWRQLIFWPLQLQNIEQPDLAPNLTIKGFEVHQTPPKLQVVNTFFTSSSGAWQECLRTLLALNI